MLLDNDTASVLYLPFSLTKYYLLIAKIEWYFVSDGHNNQPLAVERLCDHKCDWGRTCSLRIWGVNVFDNQPGTAAIKIEQDALLRHWCFIQLGWVCFCVDADGGLALEIFQTWVKPGGNQKGIRRWEVDQFLLQLKDKRIWFVETFVLICRQLGGTAHLVFIGNRHINQLERFAVISGQNESLD